MKAQRDQLFEEKFKAVEEIDVKEQQIHQVELKLQRALEEVECRKQINVQMSANLLEHEKESQEMAEKMTNIKNAMMVSDMGVGMARKYGAVKMSTFRNMPVTVSLLYLCLLIVQL